MTNKASASGQQEKETSTGSISLCDYMREIEFTDRLPKDDLRPVLLGLFGEVGGILAAAKKRHREKEAYAGYRQALEEEFGDVLWYFATLCRRLGADIETIFSDAIRQDRYNQIIAASDLPEGAVSQISSFDKTSDFSETLLNLGEATATLLRVEDLSEQTRKRLLSFLDHYLQALQAAKVNFAKIVRMNIRKAQGRFLDSKITCLPTFDRDFPAEERLPEHFEIRFTQRKIGQSYLQWNKVFIGEPLTDNILDPDGYRFHDVFHFAHVAILHWSPVFRALIKQKRKSDPEIDEAQDGGRAIVVEEGLTAWIFSRAKHLNFFDGQDPLSFDLLKTVQQFVQGYEVDDCPLSLWERAILDGYKVFRKVRENNGGIVVGNRAARTIEYKLM